MWGYSVQRLTSVLYERLLKNAADDISIERVELGVGKSVFARRVTLFTELAFRDMRRYDIIHAPTPLPLRPRRIKHDAMVITTSHGMRSLDRKGQCYRVERIDRSLAGDIMGNLVDRAVMSSDFIIAVSSLTKKLAVDRGFDPKRVFVVNNGMDDRFTKRPLRKRSRKKRKFIVGYLGPFYLRKNIIFAINAFKKIKGDNFRFEIWGRKAYEYPSLLEAARRDRRIAFMGVAPEDRLVDVYDSFDAFVYPTLCDQFPGSVVEAQSRGLPVITYKYGELSEESRRYCIEAEDEIHTASIIEGLESDGYDGKMMHKSTEYARAFTADRQAMEILDVYRKVYHGAIA